MNKFGFALLFICTVAFDGLGQAEEPDFQNFKESVRTYWSKGEYPEGIELLEQGKKRFTRRFEQHTIQYYRALMNLDADDIENSIAAFKEGFKEKFFFSLWPDYVKRLKKTEEGKSVLALNDSIQRQFNSKSKANYQLIKPVNYNPKLEYDILYFLHGNNSNLRFLQDEWAQVDLSEQRVIVVLCQSPYARSSFSFDWEDKEHSMEALKELHNEVLNEIDIKPKSIWMSGFSNGAKTGLSAFLQQPFEINGFLGFSPSFPEVLKGSLQNSVNGSGFIVTGSADYLFEQQLDMKERLLNLGIDISWNVIPDHNHDYPKNFEKYLDAAISFLRKN